MHQMALLQILQRLREHLLGTVRHETTQFIETHHSALTFIDGIKYQ